jgi:leader peptidase (prepilin peptidase) / N-methyltransferase
MIDRTQLALGMLMAGLGGAVIAVALFYRLAVWPGWPPMLASMLAMAAIAVLAARIAVDDLRSFHVADRDLLLLLLAALVWRGAECALSTNNAFAGMAACVSPSALAMVFAPALAVFFGFWAFSLAYENWRGQAAFGFADVKLLGVSALWIGWFGVSAQILLASLSALIFVGLRAWRLKRRLRLQQRLPFATFLAPSLWMVFLWFSLQPELVASR